MGGSLQEWLDGLGLLDVISLVSWTGGVIVFVWKVWPILNSVRRIADRVKDMLDDWFGEPARAGVPERPGVMVRLDRLEHSTVAAARSSASAAYDSKPNGGGSAMDHLKQEIHAEFAALRSELAQTITNNKET
jgi:hypothetical protein